jgi:hypothetical protein
MLLLSLLFGCQTHKAKLKEEGNKIVNKTERFRSENSRLPKDLNEIGIEETLEGPLYYQKIDSIDYMVWFGSSLVDL